MSVWINRRDGFEGDLIGTYCTREGEVGCVLQQIGTKIVHVYRAKYLEMIEREETAADDRRRELPRQMPDADS